MLVRQSGHEMCKSQAGQTFVAQGVQGVNTAQLRWRFKLSVMSSSSSSSLPPPPGLPPVTAGKEDSQS